MTIFSLGVILALWVKNIVSSGDLQKKQVIVSRKIDDILNDLFDLICQDFILNWYSDLAKDSAKFSSIVQYNLWLVFERFYRKLEKLDVVTFLTQDFVNTLLVHFADSRVANKKSKEYNGEKFELHSWLENDETETTLLRNIAHVLLYQLLPEEHYDLKPLRYLLREIVTVNVLKSSVDYLCDPHVINSFLLSWLKHRKNIHFKHTRYFSYAATYEEFYTIIEKCEDLEQLKYLRYKIMTEIMDVTAIINIQKHQGVDTHDDALPRTKSKGDLLRSRNLPRYLNQLGVAKSQCEKKIFSLGGKDYVRREKNAAKNEVTVLPFDKIMKTNSARQCFINYLENEAANHNAPVLVSFWAAIQNMSLSSKKNWHVMGTEIYTQFVSSSNSPIRMLLDRSCLKQMQAFLTGDHTADAFFKAQNEIFIYLNRKHYLSFIVSDDYHQYVDDKNESVLERSIRVSNSEELIDSIRIAEHTSNAQRRLQEIKEKISNKTEALKALSSIQHTNETRMKKIIDNLHTETKELKEEEKRLELHLERIDLWIDNFENFKAQVYNVEVIVEDNKQLIWAYISINVMEGKDSRGWVIGRTLEDFKAFYDQIKLLYPNHKICKETKQSAFQMAKSKFRLNKIDDKALESKKNELNEILQNVVGDKHLALSEISLAFFSQTPELLRGDSNIRETENKFSLAKLFNSFQINRTEYDEDEDDINDELFCDNPDSHNSDKEDYGKDWIAQPMYSLIAEVFELSGVSKWLRRTLISFVQITFGRSINKQLRETIKWLYSEDMVLYYLLTFKEALWPDGELITASAPCSNEEKLAIRNKLKYMLLKNIPDVAKNLIGPDNAQKGLVKIFELLQDVKLNKHLFYTMIEILLRKLFPDVFRLRSSQRLPIPTTFEEY
ncbi:DgyrCDS3651 [Dimorphilus gyrociliatus]|uniref:DgyrCDS3651 n=1 Tax=Dimorphilus gyrociliatus TaxID=2664684 RepID=A0A7I8VIY6_9ANNE|nr:DgyrCDS3651 [Dimorphilus gyrociliatus]